MHTQPDHQWLRVRREDGRERKALRRFPYGENTDRLSNKRSDSNGIKESKTELLGEGETMLSSHRRILLDNLTGPRGHSSE
jgi:hypothetical protein